MSNATIELLRAVRAKDEAAAEEERAKARFEKELLKQAFEPIRKIIDDVKHMPFRAHRYHDYGKIPFEKRVANYTPDSVTFWDCDGNYGFSIWTEMRDGKVQFAVSHRRNSPSRFYQPKYVTAKEAQDALFLFLAKAVLFE